MKKEKDEASKKRLALIEDEIKKLEHEYADLEEIWKAEEGAGRRARQHIKEELEKLRAGDGRAAARRASWTRWPSCSTASCRSWKRS